MRARAYLLQNGLLCGLRCCMVLLGGAAVADQCAVHPARSTGRIANPSCMPSVRHGGRIHYLLLFGIKTVTENRGLLEKRKQFRQRVRSIGELNGKQKSRFCLRKSKSPVLANRAVSTLVTRGESLFGSFENCF